MLKLTPAARQKSCQESYHCSQFKLFSNKADTKHNCLGSLKMTSAQYIKVLTPPSTVIKLMARVLYTLTKSVRNANRLKGIYVNPEELTETKRQKQKERILLLNFIGKCNVKFGKL